MTREEFFEKLNNGAKWDVGVSINRTNPLPLDANEIFESVTAMEAYIKDNALAYPGQVVVVLGETETAAYLVSAVGGEGKGYSKLAATTGSGDVGEELTALANRVSALEGYFEEGVAKKATADAAGNVIADTYATKTALAQVEGDVANAEADILELQTAVQTAQSTADAAVKTTDFNAFKETNTAAIAEAKKAGTDAKSALDTYIESNDAALAGVKTTADAALPKATYDEFIKTVNADVIADAKKAGTDAAAALEAYKGTNDAAVAAVKKTADDNKAAIEQINTDLEGLTGAMHFVGESTTDPTSEGGATVEGHETFKAGDVCLYGYKEYVYNGTKWVELGDEGSHATKGYVDEAVKTAKEAVETELSDAKTELEGKITTAQEAAATDATTKADAAKDAAIEAAGSAADSKITEALKAYTTTTDLTTELGKKVDKETGKSLVSDELITKMEGLQDNAVIKGVEGGIKLDAETGKISVDAANMPVIAQSKVDGLTDALNGKQDKNATLTAIAAAEGVGFIKKTADGVAIDTNTYLVETDLADYAKSAEVTAEIEEAVKDKQTAAQVNALIAAATIQGSKVEGNVAQATNADVAAKVANKLTVGGKEYDGSAAVEVTAGDLGALTEVPAATAAAIGGFKLLGEGEEAEETATHRVVKLDEHDHAYVDIPAAMVYTAKENGGLQVEDGAFSIKEVSTDKLVQGANELILNGGQA